MLKPLPPGELEISHRLKNWRVSAGLTRAALAREIHETEQRLESYEAARVPLRWSVFMKLFSRYRLNPIWLLAGKGPETASVLDLGDLPGDEPGRAIFSSVLLKHHRWLQAAGDPGYRQTQPIRAKILSAFAAAQRLDFGPEKMKDVQLRQRREMLLRFTMLLDEWQKETLALSPETIPIAHVPPHTSRLADLLKRARAATAERGAQRRLAEFLGVPRQHVHRWLSGAQEPGGETTLRLLEWVTASEANQKKTPAVSLPQPARKARAKPRDEAKQNKGRRKR